MSGIEFDTHLFPLILVINHNANTDDDYRALFVQLDAVVARGEKFVVLSEGRNDAFPSATQRKVIADWFPKVAGPMGRTSLGCAMVMHNAMQRGAITALNWLIRPNVPMAAFEERPPALAWCRERLVTGGVTIPTRVELALRGAA